MIFSIFSAFKYVLKIFPIKITEELCQFLLRINQHFPSFVETDYPLSTAPNTHLLQTFSFLPFRAHNVI